MEVKSNKKFEIEFYTDQNGKCDISDFIDELDSKAETNKDARVQLRQVLFCIDMLSRNGNNLSTNIAKHIDDEIWELRPGKNRVLYFFQKNDKYVLLHHFVKKTQKTPKKEIEKAKKEMLDYIDREGK